MDVRTLDVMKCSRREPPAISLTIIWTFAILVGGCTLVNSTEVYLSVDYGVN